MKVLTKRISTVIVSSFLLLLCSKAPQSSPIKNADGELVQGVRVVNITGKNIPDTIFVYRGDAVELLTEKNISVVAGIKPEIKGIAFVEKGNLSGVKFTAHDTGIYQIMMNEQKRLCLMRIIDFIPDTKTIVKNLSAKEAAEILKDTTIFILDVRTPAEFQEGHIRGATLIPISELADKINEISNYKNRPLMVYCRSGNRSAVALQILTKQGFTNILHLKGGIRSWNSEGLEIEK